MKKAGVCLLIVAIIILSVVGINFSEKTQVEYLRIHIRANSNLSIDQDVKYKVKDKIVEFLTPLLADCTTKGKAENVIKNNLKNIEDISDKVLKANGFDYSSNAKINNEKFPTRIYNDLTLESGYYDALIVNLGSGKGDNWWCVVYPPLCFVNSGTNYIYRSKILDIINKFFNKSVEGK